jgi:uncharacterized membrane protein
MELLIAGVLLWCAVHFVPTLAKDFKASLVDRMGAVPYKGLFAVLVFAALALIIIGWRGVDPVNLYDPPVWGVRVNNGLMVLAIFLFVAAHRPTIIRRVLRHPMLTGLSVWGVAHLFANGDQRSLIVFGGLTVWAVVEIQLINARDGAWIKPDAPGAKTEIIGLVITAVALGVIAFLHNLAGVSPFPHS